MARASELAAALAALGCARLRDSAEREKLLSQVLAVPEGSHAGSRRGTAEMGPPTIQLRSLAPTRAAM